MSVVSVAKKMPKSVNIDRRARRPFSTPAPHQRSRHQRFLDRHRLDVRSVLQLQQASKLRRHCS
jgi:hypothetical protein